MTNKNPIAFFFDEFHGGPVNVVFHCLGFAVLGYGLGIGDIGLVTLATFIMELGHFYNALRGRHKEFAFLAIPIQWAFWLLIVWGGYLLDQWFKGRQ